MPGSRSGRASAHDRLSVRVDARPPGAVTETSPDPSEPELARAGELGQQLEERLGRGELVEASAVGEQLTALLALPGLPGLPGALAHRALGELATARGDAEGALTHFRTAGGLAPDAGPDVLPWRSGAALALLRTGDGRTAVDLARAEVELATAGGSAYALAGALRTLAAVASSSERIQVLLRARAVLADRPADRLSAQIATDLAGLLLLTGEAADGPRALALLREAEEQAGRQELWPLHARVRRLLDRIGERPRHLESEAVAVLTASERRVARMAADGMTNKQIAAALVVTVKAVEWHLSHVYRKLGISSRGDLPATLGKSA